LSNEAAEIGAINTISIDHKDKKLFGYNTDYIGFNNSLTNLNLLNKKALVLGTGGASLGIKYVLGKRGIQYQMVSRNPGKTQLSYAALNSLNFDEYQLIINTTPLGTFPNIEEFPNLPFPRINQQHIAYDLVYNPSKTAFLKKCESKGATIINGLKMLELQAEASWRIWNK
jgi:shikimate dehydrogenase